MSSQLPLTIVLLTHRKGELFERALISAQFAHEVLILDNASQNDWTTLKKKLSFRLLPHPDAITNFSLVRNAALKHVRTQWVLFLDSDEVLPDTAENEIASLLTNTSYQAFRINRRDIFYGKPLRFGEAGTMSLVRLAKTSKLKFERAVHEDTTFLPQEIGNSNLTIIHYAHPSITAFITKVSLYSKLEAQQKNTGFAKNLLELLTYPIAKFVVNFVIKVGFLDGWRGLVYAVIMSLHSFWVRVHRYEMQLITNREI